MHLSEEAQAEAGGTESLPAEAETGVEPKHGNHWKPGRGKEGLGRELEKKQLITFEAT